MISFVSIRVLTLPWSASGTPVNLPPTRSIAGNSRNCHFGGLKMSSHTLIYLGVLVGAFLLLKLAPRLVIRHMFRAIFGAIGKDALAKVPDQIRLLPATAPQWKDFSAIQQQVTPLAGAGFLDQSTYSVDKMPGVLVRILFQPATYVAGHITEHPQAGNWIELVTRYTDGGSDFLTTLPDQGIEPPPFARTARAAKGTPTDSLYRQHPGQRRSSAIKPVNQNDVAHKFEDAYTRYMVWKNNKGLSPEEAATITQKWAHAKQQATGQS
jgi:hypothetical protein